jgi:hypothetical protein
MTGLRVRRSLPSHVPRTAGASTLCIETSISARRFETHTPFQAVVRDCFGRDMGVIRRSRGNQVRQWRHGMAKRELIDTGTDKRYVRRDEQGRFKESDDVGRSLSADRKRQAKSSSEPGQGDRGDRRS